MSTHFIEMDAYQTYCLEAWSLQKWIRENYGSEDFGVEYARKLKELHKMYKLI